MPDIISVQTPQSSNVAALYYLSKTKQLCVDYRGTIYAYEPVTLDEFDELQHAESIGSAIHAFRKARDGKLTSKTLNSEQAIKLRNNEEPFENKPIGWVLKSSSNPLFLALSQQSLYWEKDIKHALYFARQEDCLKFLAYIGSSFHCVPLQK